jgi:hypothetical protein
MIVLAFRLARLHPTNPLFIRFPLLIGYSQPLSISQTPWLYVLAGLARLCARPRFLAACVGISVLL